MRVGGGGGGDCGVSANENSRAHGAQRNFGDLTPYLTYDLLCEENAKGLKTNFCSISDRECLSTVF
jgi:hypothetical protein